MLNHFATNLWIFKDDHRLHNDRILQTDGFCEIFEFLLECHSFKDRIPPMEGVAYFIQTSFFWDGKLARLVKDIFLEEIANFVTRFEEVLIGILKLIKTKI